MHRAHCHTLGRKPPHCRPQSVASLPTPLDGRQATGQALGMGYLRFQVSQGHRCYLFLDTTRDPRPGEENGKGELGQMALCSGTRR